jgi:hypothetical protein
MTPQEFASKVSESTEHERLQVFLLQRIAGYLHVIATVGHRDSAHCSLAMLVPEKLKGRPEDRPFPCQSCQALPCQTPPVACVRS